MSRLKGFISITEKYLGSFQVFMMEPFCKTSYFNKCNAHSAMLTWMSTTKKLRTSFLANLIIRKPQVLLVICEFDKRIETLSCCVKCVRIESFSGPYFLAFGLKTEIYSANLRIQSECGKMRTRKKHFFKHCLIVLNFLPFNSFLPFLLRVLSDYIKIGYALHWLRNCVEK